MPLKSTRGGGGGFPSREGDKASCSFHTVRRRALYPERAVDNQSEDSEEELAAFCPQVSCVWDLHLWQVFFSSLLPSGTSYLSSKLIMGSMSAPTPCPQEL